MAASATQIAEVLAGMRAESARIVSASEQPARARLPTGSAALDALTGGGLVRGRILELSGPRSSGRMSTVLTMAAAVQSTGELVAVVDVADALDPRSAARAGVELPRLLWVRPKSVVDGLKAADWILDAGGFGMVALYLAGSDAQAVDVEAKTSWRRRQSLVRGDAPWIRLGRRAERAKSALVVVADRPLVGTVAAVSLQAERGRVRWLGGDRGAPRILDGLNGRVVIARSKLGPPAGSAELPLDVAVAPVCVPMLEQSSAADGLRKTTARGHANLRSSTDR